MGEPISAIISQQIQQPNQTLKPNPQEPTNGKSFEAHLQDKSRAAGDQVKTDKPGTETATKLEQIQAELQKKMEVPAQDPEKMTQMLKDIMGDSGGRMSMLKEAYDKLGRKGNVPSDLRGNLINTEREWNAVQQIMNSDKNLSQGELLALQQRLYMVSQHVEVMSKVVDQMAGGIKTVLNTNV
jgi:hypothetical protein